MALRERWMSSTVSLVPANMTTEEIDAFADEEMAARSLADNEIEQEMEGLDEEVGDEQPEVIKARLKDYLDALEKLLGLLGKKWRNLPEVDKKIYKDAYLKEKAAWKDKKNAIVHNFFKDSLLSEKMMGKEVEQLAKELKRVKIENKKQEELMDKPKTTLWRPFTVFCAEISREKSDMDVKKAALEWKSLSEAERVEYQKRFKKARKSYGQALDAWNVEMKSKDGLVDDLVKGAEKEAELKGRMAALSATSNEEYKLISSLKERKRKLPEFDKDVPVEWMGVWKEKDRNALEDHLSKVNLLDKRKVEQGKERVAEALNKVRTQIRKLEILANKPKRPAVPLSVFHRELSKKKSGMDVKVASKEWNALSEIQKQEYSMKCVKEMETYRQEMRAWTVKMKNSDKAKDLKDLKEEAEKLLELKKIISELT